MSLERPHSRSFREQLLAVIGFSAVMMAGEAKAHIPPLKFPELERPDYPLLEESFNEQSNPAKFTSLDQPPRGKMYVAEREADLPQPLRDDFRRLAIDEFKNSGKVTEAAVIQTVEYFKAQGAQVRVIRSEKYNEKGDLTIEFKIASQFPEDGDGYHTHGMGITIRAHLVRQAAEIRYQRALDAIKYDASTPPSPSMEVDTTPEK